MTTKSDITSAIARSISHNEIVRVVAATEEEAQALIHEAYAVAHEAGLWCYYTDIDGGYDVWACPEDEAGDKMTWRLEIKIYPTAIA
jgi:hypothetical protein